MKETHKQASRSSKGGEEYLCHQELISNPAGIFDFALLKIKRKLDAMNGLRTRTNNYQRILCIIMMIMGALHLQFHFICIEGFVSHFSSTTSDQIKNPEPHQKNLPTSTKRILRDRSSVHHLAPNVLGWVPPQFPDPRTEPNNCNIADVVRRPESGTLENENLDYEESHDLLLCDPDHIFTEAGILRLSNALREFKEKYTQDAFDTNHKGLTVNEDSPDITEKDDETNDKYVVQNVSGGNLLHNDASLRDPSLHPEIAIAVADKMDLKDILHEFALYTFEDEDDLINDAAMFFAEYLHKMWFGEQATLKHSSASSDNASSSKDRDVVNSNNSDREANGILIFLSVSDRICYIYPGKGISEILTWWRLNGAVSNNIREDMRSGDYFNALITAIGDVSRLIDQGPPTTSEKAEDFFGRFGVFILFSTATFVLALGGEYRDRRKRQEIAERVSEMNDAERQKARKMQQSFQTLSCPICLEPFGNDSDLKSGSDSDREDIKIMPRVDSFGIPLSGSDGEKLKILRCGHAFDASCWKIWISSPSCTDPGLCPVCRVDIAKSQDVKSYVSETDINSHPPSDFTQAAGNEQAYGTFSDSASGDDVVVMNAGWFVPT